MKPTGNVHYRLLSPQAGEIPSVRQIILIRLVRKYQLRRMFSVMFWKANVASMDDRVERALRIFEASGDSDSCMRVISFRVDTGYRNVFAFSSSLTWIWMNYHNSVSNIVSEY